MKVETTENKKISEKEAEKTEKSIDIPVASRTKRIIAALIDLTIGIGLALLAYAFMLKRIAITGTKIRWILLRALLPFLPAVYFLLKDSLSGKSFGKLILSLTTINVENKKPCDLTDSLLRNSLLAIVAIPILGWIAFSVFSVLIAVQIIMGRTKRIGDDFAKTMVIDDRNLEFL
jgi:hypothetical protein